MNYKFKNDAHKQKITQLKFYSYDMMMQIVKDSMCLLCQTVIHISWLLGGGNNNTSCVSQINNIGYHLGILLKVAYDFYNIDSDIEVAQKSSRNIVINLGIQKSFELFELHKQKYIECSMLLDIHTNSIKEIIDILASRIDEFIDNTVTVKEQLTTTGSSVL